MVGAFAEDVLRDVAVDVGAERLPNSLALAQPLDHRVERARECAGLVDRDDWDAHVEVARADAVGGGAQVADRAGDRV